MLIRFVKYFQTKEFSNKNANPCRQRAKSNWQQWAVHRWFLLRITKQNDLFLHWIISTVRLRAVNAAKRIEIKTKAEKEKVSTIDFKFQCYPNEKIERYKSKILYFPEWDFEFLEESKRELVTSSKFQLDRRAIVVKSIVDFSIFDDDHHRYWTSCNSSLLKTKFKWITIIRSVVQHIRWIYFFFHHSTCCSCSSLD